MVALNFSVPGARDTIRSGRKVTTIRKRNPYKEEQMMKSRILHLFEGMRTANCQRIGDYPLVSLTPFRFKSWYEALDSNDLQLINKEMRELRRIARRDGFESDAEMLIWFQDVYGQQGMRELEFTIIEWNPDWRLDGDGDA